MEQLPMFAPGGARTAPSMSIPPPPEQTRKTVNPRADSSTPVRIRQPTRPKLASSPETQCEAVAIGTGRRCLLELAIRKGCPRGFCPTHARRAAARDAVLALFCAEDVEVWDVARRTGQSEAFVVQLLAEARDVKARVRRAIAAYRANA